MITTFTNQYQMYLSEEVMQCPVYQNGVVLPRRFEENGPAWGLGGVCDEHGSFVELSAYDGGWTAHGGAYVWQQETYIDCDAVYMGLFLKHWGHLLVDCMARLWYFAQQTNLNPDIKVVYLGEEEPSGNYLECFELLGIRKEQLMRIEEPTRFRSVIVPQFACRPCIWYTKEYLSIFDCMADRVQAEGYELKTPINLERVYFSRLQFGKARGSEFGEDMIAKWLRVNSYTFVQPEQLSLRDQIYIWNHAKKIVCLNGSIPINIAFSKNKDLELVVLNKTKLVHKNLEMYLLMRPCPMTYVDVYSEPFSGYPKSIGAGPFLLCPTKDLKAYSDAAGMNWPFGRQEIVLGYIRNYLRLAWCIANPKGRIRMLLLKMLPSSLIDRIRQMRKRTR